MPKIYWPTNTPQLPPAPQPNPIDQAFDAFQQIQQMKQGREKQAMDKQLYGLKVQEAQQRLRRGEMTLKDVEQAFARKQRMQQDTDWFHDQAKNLIGLGIPPEVAFATVLPELGKRNPEAAMAQIENSDRNLARAAGEGNWPVVAIMHNLKNPDSLINAEGAKQRYAEREKITVSKGQRVMERLDRGEPTLVAEGATSPSSPFELSQTDPAAYRRYLAMNREGQSRSTPIPGSLSQTGLALMHMEASRLKSEISWRSRDIADRRAALDPTRYAGTEDDRIKELLRLSRDEGDLARIREEYRALTSQGAPAPAQSTGAPASAEDAFLQKQKAKLGLGAVAPTPQLLPTGNPALDASLALPGAPPSAQATLGLYGPRYSAVPAGQPGKLYEPKTATGEVNVQAYMEKIYSALYPGEKPPPGLINAAAQVVAANPGVPPGQMLLEWVRMRGEGGQVAQEALGKLIEVGHAMQGGIGEGLGQWDEAVQRGFTATEPRRLR